MVMRVTGARCCCDPIIPAMYWGNNGAYRGAPLDSERLWYFRPDSHPGDRTTDLHRPFFDAPRNEIYVPLSAWQEFRDFEGAFFHSLAVFDPDGNYVRTAWEMRLPDEALDPEDVGQNPSNYPNVIWSFRVYPDANVALLLLNYVKQDIGLPTFTTRLYTADAALSSSSFNWFPNGHDNDIWGSPTHLDRRDVELDVTTSDVIYSHGGVMKASDVDGGNERTIWPAAGDPPQGFPQPSQGREYERLSLEYTDDRSAVKWIHASWQQFGIARYVGRLQPDTSYGEVVYTYSPTTPDQTTLEARLEFSHGQQKLYILERGQNMLTSVDGATPQLLFHTFTSSRSLFRLGKGFVAEDGFP